MAPLISRSFRRRYLRRQRLLLSLIIILLLDAFLIASSVPEPIRTNLAAYSLRPPEKIFIASINRNSEYMMWYSLMASLIDLIKYLGPENVFVSIVESGSQDNTKGALLDLQDTLDRLKVKNAISLGQTTEEQMAFVVSVPAEDEDRTGWIYTGRTKQSPSGWELRRIPFLAKTRNLAMKPLHDLSSTMKFDKVLWINDVVFRTEDVTTLLDTNNGSYAAACSLDFSHPANPQPYYDTFALRDAEGHKTATQTYPYFRSSRSLTAMLRHLPVPVKSCWNGMVAMDAAPFYSGPRLAFRGTSDDLAREHVEGSECCLIHADNWQLRDSKGIFLNPNVRVSYNATTYDLVNPGAERESSTASGGETEPLKRRGSSTTNKKNQKRRKWPGSWEAVRGRWTNRWARAFGWEGRFGDNFFRAKIARWMAEGRARGEMREERGVECLVNEMQVLYQNGWQHV